MLLLTVFFMSCHRKQHIEALGNLLWYGSYHLFYLITVFSFLEECAHRAYNDFLHAIDQGEIENVPAGDIARQYYGLANGATLRDVVLHVRADEAYHAMYNHHFADQLGLGRGDDHHVPPEAELLRSEKD
jgi:hypothetical protein